MKNTLIEIPEEKKFRGMVIAKICHNIVFLYDKNGKDLGDKHSGVGDTINRKIFKFYTLQKQIVPEMQCFYLIGKVKKGEFYMKEAVIQSADVVEFATSDQVKAISEEIKIPLLK